MGRVRTSAAFLVLLGLSVFLLACSGADPVIYQTELRVQAIWKYPGNFRERLLVQILADDDDGFDEIYEVYVIHDDSELYWRANKEDWTIAIDSKARKWIILTNLFVSNKNIPRGTYRIILLDYSGYRAETSVKVNQPEIVYTRDNFPFLATEGQLRYKPQLNLRNDNEGPIYMELSYPKLAKNASSSKENELRGFIAFLGQNHSFYRIEKNKSLLFYLNEKSTAIAYLHYVTKTGIILSSGPYQLNFRK